MAAKRQGLRLTLPGAPNTPHTFPGVPGFFRPDLPTPVGKDGELDLDTAKDLHKEKGLALELVEIPAADVKHAEELASVALVEARTGVDDEIKFSQQNRGRAAQASRERVETQEDK